MSREYACYVQSCRDAITTALTEFQVFIESFHVDDLNVNKKNCIGTVLSMNGFKKCFRVYHAKHHEIDYYDNETDNDGSFLGFNDDDDDKDNRQH